MSQTLLLTFLRELVSEVLYVPVWWYTMGATRAFNRFSSRLQEGDEYLGWSVWVRNLFTPMYAQTDIPGRLISFAVRTVEVAVRSAGMLSWLITCMILLGFYLAAPLVVAAQLVYQWQHRGG